MELLEMDREPRYLITSSDERTWKFDRPVIFLGQWCLKHDRKHVWQNMDAIIAKPYGLGRLNKDRDYSQARSLETLLFRVLFRSLNQHHDLCHGERFWRIVLGHWVRRYVDVMLNRIKTLENCFEEHAILGTTVIKNEHYALGALDSGSAIWAFNDDRWNLALTARLLNLLDVAKCPVESIPGCKSAGFRFNLLLGTVTLRKRFLRWGRRQLSTLLSLLSRESDAFIFNSYLPNKVEIKLQLSLGQVPQLWASSKIEVSDKYDGELRTILAKKIERNSGNNLEDILFAMVFELLPVCFLEGLDQLTLLAKQQSWPKHPKFIFTSNSFDEDEVFKLWAATQTEAGTKYIVGQHGNNYGTYRYMFPSVEEATSDKFLTWGWDDGLPAHTPTFIFKMADIKGKTYFPKGDLLLIQDMYYHRIDTWDRTAEHIKYFEDQVEFIKRLSKDPLDDLTVRLHGSYRHTNPFEKEAWHQSNPTVKVDAGNANIRELIGGSRLVVHAFDSTGILETLSQDIPTLAFWANGLDHLRESAKPYYQLLVDVGIVHLTPESATQKVNEIWGDVDSWWEQSEVQVARNLFCERYAKVSENPVMDLKDILTASSW